MAKSPGDLKEPWQQKLMDSAAKDRSKVKLGQIYKRKNGCESWGYFEVVYIAFAHVVLHSTHFTEGIRCASPFVEVTQYLLDKTIKNPYILVSNW